VRPPVCAAVEVKNNIKRRWWGDLVHGRDDMVGIDSSIIMSPRVWEASGHVDGFVDPMVDCKTSKLRYRADQLYFARVSAWGDHPLSRCQKATSQLSI
jgi:glycyl-tRNA synthetase